MADPMAILLSVAMLVIGIVFTASGIISGQWELQVFGILLTFSGIYAIGIQV